MSECSICLDPSTSVDLTLNICKHSFHCSCILKWMKTNNTCPLCRELIHQIFFVKFYIKRKYIVSYKKVGAVNNFYPDYIILKYYGNGQLWVRYINIVKAESKNKKIKIYLCHPIKNQYIITIEFENLIENSFAFECIKYYINKTISI